MSLAPMGRGGSDFEGPPQDQYRRLFGGAMNPAQALLLGQPSNGLFPSLKPGQMRLPGFFIALKKPFGSGVSIAMQSERQHFLQRI